MQTRELLARLKAIEGTIKNRRINNKVSYYNTGEKVHLKQMAFHKCQKRNRWVLGGNRSGKTECGAVECVYFARGIHPFRENKRNVSGWVVSLSREVQRDVAQGKVLDYLNPDWIVDIVMVSGKAGSPRAGVIDFILVQNVNGTISKIGFKSCDQGREKFQGTSLDFVWFDEEPPEDVYNECRMRVVDRLGDIWGTMTPLLGLTFVYNKIFLNDGNDDNIWCINIEWADNPYLNQAEIEAISKTMTFEELQSRRFGKFISAKGLVYPEFDMAVHVIPTARVPREWYDNISIDPGLNNPLSAHWYAVDGDGVVIVVAEHYVAGRDVGYHCKAIKDICKSLDWHTGFGGKYTALIDSASNQRTLACSKSVAELFLDHDIAVNTNVNKDLFTGISRVKEYLIGEVLSGESSEACENGGACGNGNGDNGGVRGNGEYGESGNGNGEYGESGNGEYGESGNGESGNGSVKRTSRPKLFIMDCCVNLIREIKTYWWGNDDVPKKRDDHALDELRYFLMSRPESYKPKKAVSIVTQDIEKLIRSRRCRKR